AAGGDAPGGRAPAGGREWRGRQALVGRGRGFPVKGGGGKHKKGLFLPKKPRKFGEENPPPAVIAVEEDKGRPRPSTLDFDESRSSFDGYLAFKESRCYMLYRRPAKQGG